MNNMFSSSHTIYQPDGFNLEILCKDSKLKELANKLISNLDDGFTFNHLCVRLSCLLNEQNLFKKEPNIIYEGELHINPLARKVLLQYIWELIWDKKLMIDLYMPKYSHNSSNFCLLKTDAFDE